jgi:hypothetical protein
LRTIDIVLSAKMQNRAIELRDALRSAGWHDVDDRGLGLDSLSEFRHPGSGSARFHLIRLDRGAAAP